MTYERKLCICGNPRYLDGVKCKNCLLMDATFGSYKTVPIRKNNSRATIQKREALKRRLDAVSKGEPITPMTLQKLKKNGYVSVKYIPELSLTSKGKKLIGV